MAAHASQALQRAELDARVAALETELAADRDRAAAQQKLPKLATSFSPAARRPNEPRSRANKVYSAITGSHEDGRRERAQSLQIRRSSRAVLIEQFTTRLETQKRERRFLMDPTGRYMRRFDIASMTALAFTAFITPFEVSFLEDAGPGEEPLLFWVNRRDRLLAREDSGRDRRAPRSAGRMAPARRRRG